MSEFARLRSAADALVGSTVERPWEWSGGYPQRVFAVGSVVEIADVFENPDMPSRIAEYVAACDPPTILRLLKAADSG